MRTLVERLLGELPASDAVESVAVGLRCGVQSQRLRSCQLQAHPVCSSTCKTPGSTWRTQFAMCTVSSDSYDADTPCTAVQDRMDSKGQTALAFTAPLQRLIPREHGTTTTGRWKSPPSWTSRSLMGRARTNTFTVSVSEIGNSSSAASSVAPGRISFFGVIPLCQTSSLRSRPSHS